MQLFKKTLFIVLMPFVINIFAQGTAINTSGNSADGSAILDVSSTAQGMLVPRMTAAQRGSISSPATGLIVYQTNGTAGFYYNAGTPGSPNWVILLNGSSLLNASNLSSGTVTTARLGSGNAYPSTFLRGNNTWGGLHTLSVLDASSATTFDCSNTSVDIWVIDANNSFISSQTLNIDIPAASAVASGTLLRFDIVSSSDGAPTVALQSPGSTYNAINQNDLNISSANTSIGVSTFLTIVSDGVSRWFKIQ